MQLLPVQPRRNHMTRARSRTRPWTWTWPTVYSSWFDIDPHQCPLTILRGSAHIEQQPPEHSSVDTLEPCWYHTYSSEPTTCGRSFSTPPNQRLLLLIQTSLKVHLETSLLQSSRATRPFQGAKVTGVRVSVRQVNEAARLLTCKWRR